MHSPRNNCLENIFEAMDHDPAAARVAFAFRVRRLFERTPPRLFDFWVEMGCGDHIDELTNMVCLHCFSDDFRKLRLFPFLVGETRPDEGRFDRWILTVARNLIAVDLRRSIREIPVDPSSFPDIEDPHPTPDVVTEGSEAVGHIEAAIESLPPRQRERLRERIAGKRPRDLVDPGGCGDTLEARKRISEEARHARRRFAEVLVRREPDFVASLPESLRRHFPSSKQRRCDTAPGAASCPSDPRTRWSKSPPPQRKIS